MNNYKNKGLPWSNGLSKDVKDCKTSKDVMKTAGLDFTVAKCQLKSEMPISFNGSNDYDENNGEFAYNGHIYRDCPSAFGTYRTDENIPLGIVKSKYEVVQNTEAFQFFDEVIGNDVQWETAGMFGYGEKIFVSAKLNLQTDVDGDPIDNYLVFSNSHDGSSAVNILFSPIRVMCTNMLPSAFKTADSYVRIRHTSSVKDKLAFGKEILKASFEHARNATQIFQALRTINMNDAKVMQFIADLHLTEEEKSKLFTLDNQGCYHRLMRRDYYILQEAGISTRKANTILNMWDYYHNGIAQKDIVGNAWGALNAVTGYYSHATNTEGEKRTQSLLYGSAYDIFTKSLNVLSAAM